MDEIPIKKYGNLNLLHCFWLESNYLNGVWALNNILIEEKKLLICARIHRINFNKRPALYFTGNFSRSICCVRK